MHHLPIRRVKRSDLDSCYALEKVCYTELEVAPRDFIEKRIETYPDGFYVAETDGRVVGMINSGATHREDITGQDLKYLVGHVRNGRNAVIFSLAVHPDFRGMGLARKLVQQLIELSGLKQKERILLLCRRELVGFYTSLDFTCMGPSMCGYGDGLLYQMQYQLAMPSWLAEDHRNSAPLSW